MLLYNDNLKLINFLKECFLSTGREKFDSVVLGCTHYPFVKDTIARLQPEASIYDGGEGTARQLKRLLEKDNLISDSTNNGFVVFENTLESNEVNQRARTLLDT